MRRWFSMLMLAALLIAGLPSIAAAHNQCFPQTGFCLEDPFSDYWESNGGLPVFGYPINAAADEANSDTGQTYKTQWLERNRFEIHPENAGTPYEILLGLLGKTRLTQLNRGVEPREAGAIAGCLWFEDTGHNVCDQAQGLGFKSYWQSNGLKIPGLDAYARSLQLFGLPLTSATMETNANGDTVITQWFERARFEWHPNNPDQYKVLLGLLGKEVRENTPPPQPIVLSGIGAKVTDPIMIPFGYARATFTHDGRSNFIVWAYQGSDRDLVVNEIGAYTGSRFVAGKKETFFEIDADGTWSLRLEPLGYNQGIATGGIQGRGDTVSDLFEPAKIGNIPYRFSHNGNSNFIVWLYCTGGNDLIQNEIGPVASEAVARFSKGPCFYEVQADGDWSIAPK